MKTAREVIEALVNETEPVRRLHRAGAFTEVLIADLDAAGYVIVPKEPTEDMNFRGAVIGGPECGMDNARDLYRAMIEARPK